ncbi:hypothetical protein A8L59_11930 [Pseudomonas koreensis]|uniref:Uncharacterized protein n=2 Tax=Pseudomonas koreensis TaxID=198620 RepID=A0AAC9BSL7_9PSED|nr:hypothetical protein A8L59_11930 [Pseudomonas koreensis]
MQMATTGNFSFKTDAHGSFQANELTLSEVGNLFKVAAVQRINAKSSNWFSMDIEKFEGTKTFKDKQLPVIKYISRSDDFTFKYTVNSGSLTATIKAGVLAISGTLDLEMTADPDSDSQGPKTLRITDGVFDLKN